MRQLLKELKKYHRTHKRDLPWRRTRDPYKILVSEVMLQQTQVERVVPFYSTFIRQFPTASALARAPLSKVLKAWSGLGYNRRAKFLHQAAKKIAKSGFPKCAEEIEKLPGVGHYTARAVVAFAYNKPEVFVETNIRTVFLYYFFQQKRTIRKKVSDKEILPHLEEALKRSRMQPRDFYQALMNYGSFLKRSGVRLNQKSAHYTKQSKFEGSRRQKRAARLRTLLASGASEKELEKVLYSK